MVGSNVSSFLCGMLTACILIFVLTTGTIMLFPEPDSNEVYRFKVIAVSEMVAVEGTFETQLPINPGDKWTMVFMKQEVSD
ncbi:MAG: hypothetical protein KAJ06_11840 [Gammaproteobacteria bacterium]|nr:hypothetical protein [Gammaproteobacteria bacterium]